MTDEEKDDFKGQVDEQTDKPGVDKVVEEAKKKDQENKDNKDLADYKEKAKEEIGNLPNLTEEEKKDFKGQVDQQTDKPGVDKVVEEAKKKDQENKDKKDLDEYKEKAKEEIGNLPNLTKEEKDDFKGQVDQQTDKPGVDKVVEEAKAKDKKNLEDYKEKAKEEIGNLPNLDDQEKKDFKDKVDEQTDKPGVDKVVEEAKKKDQENKDKKDLADYKEKAKEEIGNLPNLTDDEKKDFKDKVDEQTDKPGVDKVVEEAKKAAEKTPGQDPKVVGPVDPTDPNGGKPADTSKYYVVTFVSSDTEKGTVAAKNTVYVLKTETKTLAEITAPEKTAKTGYEFDKWEPALDANTIVTGDMEVKAYFKASGTTPTPPPTPTPEPTPSYPGYEYNPFWSIYFRSGTATTNKTIEPQKKIVMKLQTKLVIGSKEMIKSVDGVEQKVMMDIAPFIESNRTMLPIRFVAEALGFKVEWDDPSRTVILTDKDNVVKIPVDTNKIIVNGVEYESDVKPVLRNNRTMLPIGNIARALGLKDGTDIIWDAATRTVVIKREIEK